MEACVCEEDVVPSMDVKDHTCEECGGVGECIPFLSREEWELKWLNDPYVVAERQVAQFIKDEARRLGF